MTVVDPRNGFGAVLAENERLRHKLARLATLVDEAEAHGSKVLDLYTIRVKVLS